MVSRLNNVHLIKSKINIAFWGDFILPSIERSFRNNFVVELYSVNAFGAGRIKIVLKNFLEKRIFTFLSLKI